MVDEFSRYTWVFFLKTKGDVAEENHRIYKEDGKAEFYKSEAT